MTKILKVKCPQCATIFTYYESEYRPFCSERCKMIDLGHWFEESYKVPDKNKAPNGNENENYEEEPENYEQSYDEQEDESEYE